MLSRLVLTCVLLLFSTRAYSQAGFHASAGIGGVRSGLGGIASIQGHYDHWVSGVRLAYGSSKGSFSSEIDIPDERIADYALMFGIGSFGKRGFAELLVGPSLSQGVIQGSLDSVVKNYGFFGGETRYYQPITIDKIGVTAEAKIGMNLGFGFTLFTTTTKQVTYAGFSLDVVLGPVKSDDVITKDSSSTKDILQ